MATITKDEAVPKGFNAQRVYTILFIFYKKKKKFRKYEANTYIYIYLILLIDITYNSLLLLFSQRGLKMTYNHIKNGCRFIFATF